MACSIFSLICFNWFSVSDQRFADAGGGGTGLVAFAGGVLKIAAHRLLDFFARAQQPKNDEERHHGRYEVGIGHLPGPAMLVVMVVGLLANDDDRLNALFCTQAAASDAGAPAGFRHALSISWNVGLT